MPEFGQAHKLLSARHSDTEPPAAGADPSDGQIPAWSAADKAWIATDPPSPGVTIHGLLDGLLVDDHPIYALLAGRSGGQTLKGGTGSGEHLTLQSTAHVTRGRVKVQDDLQLLSDILRDSGGNNRLQLGVTSPELTLTGNAKITGNVGIAGSTPNAMKGLDVTPYPYPTGTSYQAIGGIGVLEYPAGGSGGTLYGLNFMVAVGVGGGGASISNVIALNARPAAMGFVGTILNMYGIYQMTPFITGGTPSVTTYKAIGIDACLSPKIVNAYQVQIGDILNNLGFARLLEVGPATPYWRVAGGGDAAAGFSNCSIKIADVLSQIRTRTINGYTCLTID